MMTNYNKKLVMKFAKEKRQFKTKVFFGKLLHSQYGKFVMIEKR